LPNQKQNLPKTFHIYITPKMNKFIAATALQSACCSAVRMESGAAAAPLREISLDALQLLQDQELSRTGYADMHGAGQDWNMMAEWGEKDKHSYIEAIDERGNMLEIDGHEVMQQWETPYMQALAKEAMAPFNKETSGVILEVGLGLGLSARQIQKCALDQKAQMTHIIIEGNGKVIEQEGARFREDIGEDAFSRVKFINAMWQDAVADLEDESIDAVLYDPYPNTAAEQHVHQHLFIKAIFPKLKPGARLVYCNLTSLGVLRGDYDMPEDGPHGKALTREQSWGLVWDKTQKHHLEKIGFSELSYSLFEFPLGWHMMPGGYPPKNCNYYSWNQGLVPLCIK